jgi:hypothetical protein
MIKLIIYGIKWKSTDKNFDHLMRNSCDANVAAIAAVFLTRIDFAPLEPRSILWTGHRFVTVEFNHGRQTHHSMPGR